MTVEVFSTVVVEISATVCAFLPVDDNSGHNRHCEIQPDDTSTGTHGSSLECFGHESSQLPDNYRAEFLKEKMKELNVSVLVISEALNDTVSSLKLRGAWSEICAVRTWLLQFIETPNNIQDTCSVEQLDAVTRREAAVTEHCSESSDIQRRSLRKRHTSRQDCNADTVLLSAVAKSSKQTKTKLSEKNHAPMKKSKAPSINTAQNKSGNFDAGEEMFESYSMHDLCIISFSE